jgi:hypothetical protein
VPARPATITHGAVALNRGAATPSVSPGRWPFHAMMNSPASFIATSGLACVPVGLSLAATLPLSGVPLPLNRRK